MVAGLLAGVGMGVVLSVGTDVLGLRGEDGPGPDLLRTVVEDGSLVSPLPSLDESRDRRRDQVERLPPETRALRGQETHPVETSDGHQSTTRTVRAALAARQRLDER